MIGGVLFTNPLINLLNLNRTLMFKIENFFASTGFFGYWGVFTGLREQSNDIRIIVRTTQGDSCWYFIRDRKYIPFFKIYTDNTMVLLTHFLKNDLCSKLMLGNLLNRIFKFYEFKNIKVLEVRIQMVSLQSGSDKDYMHDLSKHSDHRRLTYMHWKDGEQIPKISEEL
jgi:hypothetical protein